MSLQRTPDRELVLLAIGLCVVAIASCNKETEKLADSPTAKGAPSAPRAINADVADPTKIWRELNLSQTDTVIESQSKIESRIKARNQVCRQTDVGSFATAARLESSIARGIAIALKSGQMTSEAARQLSNQMSVLALNPTALATALAVTLDEAKTKVISNSTSRYEAFSTLFGAMPGEPSEDIQRQIAASGSDEWLITGKWPFMNLCKIVEARVQLAALEVLIQYVQRGGQLTVAPAKLEYDLKRLVPESFEDERLPEAGFLRSTHLRPSDVIGLLESEQ